MVPLRNATTLLGMPARRRLSAPRMLRVRPVQFTTTSVFFGSGARSPMRYTSSPPGTLIPFGIDMRVNSSRACGCRARLMLRPSSIQAFNSGASTLSVP